MASGSRDNPLALLQFPFSAGIDEANRDEIVDPGGGWAVLENGRQDHRGGYSTRTGFTYLTSLRSNGVGASAGYKMFADRKSVCRITETPNLETFSSAANRWQSLGRVPEVMASVVDLPSMGTTVYLEDVDATNGYLALGWHTLVGATVTTFVGVVDQVTGSVVRAPEIIGAGSAGSIPQLAVVGSKFILVRADSGATTFKAWYLDTTSATTIDAGWVAFGASLCTDSAAAFFSLLSLPAGSGSARVAFLYNNNSGGTDRLTLKTFDTTGVLETKTIATASTTPDVWSLGGVSTDTLWLVWNESTNVRALGLHPFAITTTALATVATVVTTAASVDYLAIAAGPTGKARIVADTSAAIRLAVLCGVKTTAGAAAVDGTAQTFAGAQAIRKPFYYGGRYYTAFVSEIPNTQNVFAICDFTDDVPFVRPVANLAPGLATHGLFGQGKFIAGSTSSQFFVGFGIARSGVATGSAYAVLDFASSARWQTVSWGNSTYFNGGVPSCFDGTRAAEIGFLVRPKIPVVTTASTGFSLTTGRRYIAVYEEVDADGNWHQSGLSTPSAASGVVADKTITVTTSPLTISSRLSSVGASSRTVRVAWYATADNGGIAPYYRHSTTINNPAATTVTMTDAVTDAVLITGAKLYSQPGVIGTSQDKRPPPPFSCLVAYNGMLVGASGSDVWYSGQNVSGEGAWFNPIFQVPVPGDGDITAMWAMDGTLFVSKRREIYAITGEAPSDNGASGGLGTPRRLSVDVGCIESRSPCVTTFGTFFQSDRGIEILTRAQSVEWIGEEIQDTQSSYPIVTSATVEPASCTVLIECAASESAGAVTGTGRTLVYDLSLRKWVSTDRRKSSTGTADTPSQSACMIWTGSAYRYAWLSALGVVHYENPGSYLDAGTIVAKRAVSANVKAGGLQGFQHVNKTLLLAKYHTPHDLNMTFAYDYSSTYKTVRLYTAVQLLAISTTIPNMQLEHPMHDDARCEAVRVQLQDVTPSSGTLGTGQGATWIALAFEVVPQTGAYGLPDASR